MDIDYGYKHPQLPPYYKVEVYVYKKIYLVFFTFVIKLLII